MTEELVVGKRTARKGVFYTHIYPARYSQSGLRVLNNSVADVLPPRDVSRRQDYCLGLVAGGVVSGLTGFHWLLLVMVVVGASLALAVPTLERSGCDPCLEDRPTSCQLVQRNR